MKKYFAILSVLCLLLAGRSAPAYTGLVLQDGDRVWVGNNEDWFNPRTKIWFIQPANNRYGSVFFGFDNFWPQGGKSSLIYEAQVKHWPVRWASVLQAAGTQCKGHGLSATAVKYK